MHYENASYVVVVYDIGNRASFDHVLTWLSKVKAQRPQNAPPLPGVLIANKIDLRSDEPDAPTVPPRHRHARSTRSTYRAQRTRRIHCTHDLPSSQGGDD